MTRRPECLARWRSGLLTAAMAGFLAMSLGGVMLFDLNAANDNPVAAQEQNPPPAGTPVVAEPTLEASDPLDGTPRDRDVRADTGEPRGQQRLEIVRSGRPNQAPPTLFAYDDDPETSWTPDSASEATWLWFDLGDERRVREVRWLTQGSGTVDVAVSSDRERWHDVDRIATRRGWQGMPLRADAQYVRLTLAPEDNGPLPALSEVAVYGSERDGDVALEQNADDEPRRRKRDRASPDSSTSRQKADAGDTSANRKQRGNGESSGRVQISTEPGETDCKGKRARCQAREGKVRVEEDCTESGSCTIDVQADGGAATCDASGGDNASTGEIEDRRDRDREGGGRRNRDNASREQDAEADDDEENRGGRGGRCEATANGGAVTIGDINP